MGLVHLQVELGPQAVALLEAGILLEGFIDGVEGLGEVVELAVGDGEQEEGFVIIGECRADDELAIGDLFEAEVFGKFADGEGVLAQVHIADAAQVEGLEVSGVVLQVLLEVEGGRLHIVGFEIEILGRDEQPVVVGRRVDFAETAVEGRAEGPRDYSAGERVVASMALRAHLCYRDNKEWRMNEEAYIAMNGKVVQSPNREV